MRTAVLVSGGGTNLQALIDAKKDGRLPEVEFVCVVSNRKKAYALERARQNRIEAIYLSTLKFENADAYNTALRDLLMERQVEAVVLAGFLVVLSPVMIKAYPGHILNIHPSLIPSFCGDGYYGLKVHEAALARGVKVSGATVHIVDEGTDTGPIVLQKAVYVQEGDTPQVLQRRIMEEAEWKILPEALELLAEGRIQIEDGRAHILPEA